MNAELTKEWCMNMAKIEARAEELHEGCQMPMEQAHDLAASEMSEGRKALLAAFGAAAAAREQDLRGQYPKAARVLAEEVFSLRAALRQKCAEYDDMKSLLLGNARNLNLEGEQARQTAEYWKAEYLAGNTRIGELHDDLAETASRAADYLRIAIKAEAEVALLRAALNGGNVIERLQFALQRLADAADGVGVKHFDTDWLSDEVQELQAATHAARLVLGPNVGSNRPWPQQEQR